MGYPRAKCERTLKIHKTLAFAEKPGSYFDWQIISMPGNPRLVRANQPGTITLTFRAEGLKTATGRINSKLVQSCRPMRLAVIGIARGRFSEYNFPMSLHRSLRSGGSTAAKRNVLKRFERVTLLKKRGQWKAGMKSTGLPKTKPE